MSPLMSVVIPAYNSEKYIGECLQSILSQSFVNFECIVINDGSSDRTGEIAENFCLKDSRFRVFHQPNTGVSAARKAGVEKALGEYIVFVDSDDTLPIDTLKFFALYSTKWDFVISENIRESELDGRELVRLLMEGEVGRALWGKMIRKKLLESCVFPPASIKMGEDYLLNLQLARKTDKIRLISPLLYHYRRHPESVVATYRRTLDYEKVFYRELVNVLSYSDWKERFFPFLVHHKFHALKGIIRKKGKVNFNDPFVRDLIRDSRNVHLTLEEKLVLILKDSILCTYVIKLFCRMRIFCKSCFSIRRKRK